MFERTFVGLDVHARSVSACAFDTVTGEVVRGRLAGDNAAVLAWVAALPGPAAAVYEAGPTGYGLARLFAAAGIRCVVAAPSKLIRPPGDRVKTDARDALHLARLLKLGEITEVRVPGLEEEAVRDLVRAREDVRTDLMRARQRLSKLLLRRGIVYSGGQAWTKEHATWLHRQRFEDRSVRLVFENYLEAVELTGDRRDRLDARIAEAAGNSTFTPVVRALECLRGISDLTALGLAVEIGDWTRFTGASIAPFLGLVPSERSSGATRSQGPITKTGNTHARRLLVEAAWHHRKDYSHPSEVMRKRWDKATEGCRVRGHQGNRRLHQRWESFDARHKRSTVANVAIARELAGWCWSLAVQVQEGTTA